MDELLRIATERPCNPLSTMQALLLLSQIRRFVFPPVREGNAPRRVAMLM